MQSPCKGWKFPAPVTVADGGLHRTLVLGPAQPLALPGDDLTAARSVRAGEARQSDLRGIALAGLAVACTA